MSPPSQNLETPFTFDVFLSHSSHNKSQARRLAAQLRDHGLAVWFDEWVIKPGDLISLQIERGLQESRVLVLLMSKEAFNSNWVALERHTALFRDPTSRERRFIPVRMDDATPPEALRQFAYVDLRQESDREFARLVEVCQKPNVKRPAASQRPTHAIMRTKSKVVLGVDLDDSKPLGICAGSSGLEVWDLSNGVRTRSLETHTGTVVSVSLARQGNVFGSCSHDGSVRIWDRNRVQCLQILRGHVGKVLGVALSPDGSLAVSGGGDRTIRVWDVDTGVCRLVLRGHTDDVVAVSISVAHGLILSGSRDMDVRCWGLWDGHLRSVLRGHTDWVQAVAVSEFHPTGISAGMDGTIRAWDLDDGRELGRFEGHTGPIEGLAFSGNGALFASASHDRTVRVWDLKTRRCTSVLGAHSRGVPSVALSYDGEIALVGCADGSLHLWRDYKPVAVDDSEESLPYVNAKVLVVGESSAGKTALTIRLATNQFEPTVSSDGVWAAQVALPNSKVDPGEKEVWLWDFAGQADYRPIHQLFMDDTAMVLLVFNPQVRDALDRLREWDFMLASVAARPRKLLVSSRADRGGFDDHRSIDAFVRQCGYDGYFETSALLGTGIAELRSAIQSAIPWNEIPWVTTTRRFRQLKLAILTLRQQGRHLMSLAEIKQTLTVMLPREELNVEEIKIALKLLIGPGVVWQVGFGDLFLVNPEIVNKYAGALFRCIRKESRVGCIRENVLLRGDLDFQGLARLSRPEEELLLRALCEATIRNGLCIRDSSPEGTQLIFPFLHLDDGPAEEDDVSPVMYFPVLGVVETLYAVLVVRIVYCGKFPKYKLSRRAATFYVSAGQSIRLELLRESAQKARIMVRASRECKTPLLAFFIQYVSTNLHTYMQGTVPFRCLECPVCGEQVKDSQAVAFRRKAGKASIPCNFCDAQVPLMNDLDNVLMEGNTADVVSALSATADHEMGRQRDAVLLVGHIQVVALEIGAELIYERRPDLGADAMLKFPAIPGRSEATVVWLQMNSESLYIRRRVLDESDEFLFRSTELGRRLRMTREHVAATYFGSDRSIYWKPLWAGSIAEEQHGFTSFSYSFSEGERFTSFSLARAIGSFDH